VDSNYLDRRTLSIGHRLQRLVRHRRVEYALVRRMLVVLYTYVERLRYIRSDPVIYQQPVFESASYGHHVLCKADDLS